ncbi:MAG TPA: tripartite tricarboxylate transporter TctB family protein [Phototrophicaceae bacterium]|nr:tripartite tricarboxylate transporter TctB family protein [Phototrophicaceae bacterium]
MKIRPAAIFSFCALIFFCVFVYQAHDWRMQARLYPWAIGIPMIILALIQVIFDLKGIESKADDAAPVDIQMGQNVPPDIAFKRTVNIFAWFFAFFFGCWLIGFTVTIPIIVFSYMYFHGKEKLWLSATLTVIAFIFFWSLFVRLLNLPFPDGLVQTWLGWV